MRFRNDLRAQINLMNINILGLPGCAFSKEEYNLYNGGKKVWIDV